MKVPQCFIQWEIVLLLLLCCLQTIAAFLWSKSFTFHYSKEPGTAQTAEKGPVIDTTCGRVRGAYTSKAQVFLSIPYAEPPTDLLRWADPRPKSCWNGIKNVTAYPPICPQSVIEGSTFEHTYSEDCLYLNIFAPRNMTTEEKLPVMVFIHGGAFVSGYSALPVYDGQYIANQTSTIVVTVNYRLGVLGFLAFKGSDEMLGGNYGVRDQRLAMQWVHDNIENFGGNRSAITLWGESAGAMSVAIHVTSPMSSGLFSRAIIESNPFAYPFNSLAVAQHQGKLFADKVRCKTVACLREVKAEVLVEKQLKIRWSGIAENIIFGDPKSEILLPWTPVVDNVDLVGQPLGLLAAGKVFSNVPMIVGTNSHEMWLFIYCIKSRLITYHSLLRIFWVREIVDEIVKFYPPPRHFLQDSRPQLANLTTDFAFVCATLHAVSGAVGHQTNKVWLYDFAHASSWNIWASIPACSGIACHGDELPFVFHNLNGSATAREAKLSEEMVDYWTSFAKYGEPNQQPLPKWPEYTFSNPVSFRFDTPIHVAKKNYSSKACSLWDKIGYNF